MNHTATIALYQPVLHSIAVRIVGSIHDAEDIVQDAFLKYLSMDHSKIENIKAYLIKSVTNISLNHIKASKQKKKDYLESVKLPELFEKIDFSHLDMKEEVTTALNVLHKKLGPLERGLFLLREGFGFEYEELQEIFNKKKDHCRQLVCRAKEKLSKESERFTMSFDVEKYFEAINKASQKGDFNELMDHIFERGPAE